MGFLELRQEPGVYSRVTAGMSIRNSSLFQPQPPTPGLACSVPCCPPGLCGAPERLLRIAGNECHRH